MSLGHYRSITSSSSAFLALRRSAHYWGEISRSSGSPAVFLSPRHGVIKQIINVIAIAGREGERGRIAIASCCGAYRYAMVARRYGTLTNATAASCTLQIGGEARIPATPGPPRARKTAVGRDLETRFCFYDCPPCTACGSEQRGSRYSATPVPIYLRISVSYLDKVSRHSVKITPTVYRNLNRSSNTRTE